MIEFGEIAKNEDPFAIKNFIISDNSQPLPQISYEHPFVLDGVAFVICIKGSGHIRVNFREFPVEKNTIITILPRYVIEVKEKSDDLLLEYLGFTSDFISEMPVSSHIDIAKAILRAPVLRVTEPEVGRLLEFHSFIVNQYKRMEHPYRIEMARTLLYALLIEIAAIYSQVAKRDDGELPLDRKGHYDELVTRFLKLVMTHHKQEKGLRFYADKMFLTPKYLSTVIKERTGRTAFVWINDAVVASVKYALKTSGMTVAQISEDMNFPNASFFGRFFKKHTGLTPLQYRESR